MPAQFFPIQQKNLVDQIIGTASSVAQSVSGLRTAALQRQMLMAQNQRLDAQAAESQAMFAMQKEQNNYQKTLRPITEQLLRAQADQAMQEVGPTGLAQQRTSAAISQAQAARDQVELTKTHYTNQNIQAENELKEKRRQFNETQKARVIEIFGQKKINDLEFIMRMAGIKMNKGVKMSILEEAQLSKEYPNIIKAISEAPETGEKAVDFSNKGVMMDFLRVNYPAAFNELAPYFLLQNLTGQGTDMKSQLDAAMGAGIDSKKFIKSFSGQDLAKAVGAYLGKTKKKADIPAKIEAYGDLLSRVRELPEKPTRAQLDELARASRELELSPEQEKEIVAELTKRGVNN